MNIVNIQKKCKNNREKYFKLRFCMNCQQDGKLINLWCLANLSKNGYDLQWTFSYHTQCTMENVNSIQIVILHQQI